MKTPPSKDDFAKHMMDRIRQTGEKGKIVYDSKEFSLRGEGKTYAAMFLTNAYKEYCAAPLADRSRVVRHYVRNWFAAAKEMPEDFEDVKPDLLPVVRSRSHFEINNLEVVDGIPLNWPYEVLGEHFGVGIVYDLPEAMRSIPQGSLDAWGVTFYEALEAAMENLLSLEAKFIGPESGEGRLSFGHGRQLRCLSPADKGRDSPFSGQGRPHRHDPQSGKSDRRGVGGC